MELLGQFFPFCYEVWIEVGVCWFSQSYKGMLWCVVKLGKALARASEPSFPFDTKIFF